jgi:hypothetical protein
MSTTSKLDLHTSQDHQGFEIGASAPLRTCAMFAAAFVMASMLAWNAHGATKTGLDDSVNELYGSFQKHIALELPAFRTITPTPSLDHASSPRNGRVGVGWSLGGFSVIEYSGVQNGNQSYVLDGQPLVPCSTLNDHSGTNSASNVPSCAADAQWATRMESCRIVAK